LRDGFEKYAVAVAADAYLAAVETVSFWKSNRLRTARPKDFCFFQDGASV